MNLNINLTPEAEKAFSVLREMSGGEREASLVISDAVVSFHAHLTKDDGQTSPVMLATLDRAEKIVLEYLLEENYDTSKKRTKSAVKEFFDAIRRGDFVNDNVAHLLFGVYDALGTYTERDTPLDDLYRMFGYLWHFEGGRALLASGSAEKAKKVKNAKETS